MFVKGRHTLFLHKKASAYHENTSSKESKLTFFEEQETAVRQKKNM
jgi:hypothetical protein